MNQAKEWLLRMVRERETLFPKSWKKRQKEFIRVQWSLRQFSSTEETIAVGHGLPKALVPSSITANKTSLQFFLSRDAVSRLHIRFQELIKKYSHHRLWLVEWSLKEILVSDTLLSSTQGFVHNAFPHLHLRWSIASPQEILHRSIALPSLDAWDFPRTLEKNCRYLLSLSSPSTPSPQRIPILLSATLGGMFLHSLYRWIHQQPTKPTLPKPWRLVDDPGHPCYWKRRTADDEGVPVDKTILWKESCFAPLSSLREAWRNNEKPTGHAHRPYLHEPPFSSPHTLFFEGKTLSLEELLSYFPRTIYLETPMESQLTKRSTWHLWANGWLVQGGKFQEYYPCIYVKNPLPRLLETLTAVGKPQSFTPSIPAAAEMPLLFSAGNIYPP